MTLLQITSLLIVLAGAFGAINYLFLKLPSAIGILVVSLVASLVVMFSSMAARTRRSVSSAASCNIENDHS